ARYWLAPSSPAAARSSASGRSSGHPLIGRRLRSAGRGAQFEAELGAGSTAYLEDHRVHDVAVLPVTGFVEMFLAAGTKVLGSAACRVEDLALQEALVLPEQGGCTVQLVAGPIADGRMPCEVWSLVADEDRDDAWRLHAIATVRGGEGSARPAVSLAEIRARCTEVMEADKLYADMRARGVEHRGAFCAVTGLWRAEAEALAEVRLPADVDVAAYEIHPALLDACLQPIAAVLPERTASYLPVSIERVERHAAPTAPCWSHAMLRSGAGAGGAVVADVRVVDAAGSLLLAVHGVRLVPAGRDALHRLGSARVRGLLYELTWKAAPIAGGEPAAEALPGPLTLATAVTPEIAQARVRHDLATYDA
ncbi:MAG TPA: polyketide synthase dehydratase domain-containing protein, partial [Planctomycetota bacterium]|nr:polyketide synthase dehydratase domain-containing protein [Planctomycetota bacterium]